MKNKFIYSPTKSLFEKKLAAGEIGEGSIVFIEDTKEIWNRGHCFGTVGSGSGSGSGIDPEILSGIETAIATLQSDKADKSELADYAKKNELPSLDGYLTKTVADGLYATIAQYNTLNQTVGNIQTELSNKATKDELSTGLAGKLDNSAASGFVPITRKVNGVALDEDITITATDPNAATKTELNSVNTDLQTFKSNVATTYATDKDVADAISALVDSSPETLNTLNELSAALGDDPNFATTVATNIGKKADQSALDTTNTNVANLNTALDDKLSLSQGGTVNGLLQVTSNINAPFRVFSTSTTTRIGFYNNGTLWGYFGFSDQDKPIFVTSGGVHQSILTSAGGTITGSSGALTIARTDADQIGVLFKGKSGNLGFLGFSSSGTPAYIATTGNPYTLLHSGNIGEYKAGDSDKLGGNSLMTEVTDWNSYQTSIFKSSQMNTANAPTTDFCYGLQMRFHRNVTSFYTDLATAIYKDELYYRRHTDKGFGDWKTIAFTDSTVEAAKKIVDGNGNTKVSVLSNGYVVANGFYLTADVIERANTTDALYLQYNAKGNTIINANGGNVLIGTTTDNGAKLQVNGAFTATSGSIGGETIATQTWVNNQGFKKTDTNTTYTFASGTNGFTVTPSGGTAQTITVTPSISKNVTYTGTLVDEQVATFEGTSGQIKASGYTIAASVPSGAKFTDTDTKVTSVGNHYSPEEDTNAAISASSGSATNITGTSGKLNVVTGLKRDAKGHIVGVTSANIYSTDNNTTYSSKTAASGGTDVSLVTTGEKYTWNAKASTAVATTSANGLMSSGDKSKLDGIASGATAVTESTVSGWGFTKNAGDITGVTAGSGLTGGASSGAATLNVGAGTGISVGDDAVNLKTAATTEIGGIKIGKDNSSYAVTASTSSISADVTSGKYYAVEIDKNDKAFVHVPWTDNNTTSFTITASASDDDVVVLSGTNGTNKVTYSASHAKKGPSSGYTSGNSTTSISGSGASKTIKIPQLTVDSYGHVTAAADEDVTITMPTIPAIPTSLKNPTSLTLQINGSTKATYDGSSAKTFNVTPSDLGLSAALKYCGITTTALTDGATTNPIKINNADHTASAGCVVFYGDKEYVFNGTNWEELGYARTLTLNKVNTGANSGTNFSAAPGGHTHSVTAAGSVSSSFTGSAATSGKNSGTNFSAAPGGHTHSVTASGSVSSSFTGSAVTSGKPSSNTTSVATAAHTHSVTGTVDSGGASHKHSFTPAGSVSSSFTGSAVTSGAPNSTNGTTSVATAAHTHSVTGTVANGGASHTHSVSLTTGSGDKSHSHSYTPSGSVTLAGSATGGVLTITATFAGTATNTGNTSISHTHSVSGNTGATTATHSHTFSSGSASATADNTTNRVSVAGSAHTHNVTASGSVSSSFTGTASNTGSTTASHTHTFSSGAASATADDTTNRVSVPNTSHTHSVTAAGSVSSSFTGSAVTSGANSGTNTSVAPAEHTHSVTAKGSVSSSFTGSAVTSGANSGTNTSVAPASHTHSVTPTGSIS